MNVFKQRLRRPRRFWALLGATALGVVIALGLATTPASALHLSGLFEVEDIDENTGDFDNDPNTADTTESDANAVANDGPGDDWDLLDDNSNGTDPNNDDSSLRSTGIVHDEGSAAPGHPDVFPSDDGPPNPPNLAVKPEDIFTGGLTKDINDVSSWRWKVASGFPDKNDITHAYAAAYTCPMGNSFCAANDLVVAFGADRFDNSGDAFLGFWFFQNPITLVAGSPTGSFGGGGHVARDQNGPGTPGDLLVLVDYPQASNAIPILRVLEWVSSGGNVSTNLDEIFNSQGSGTSARCGDVANDTVCASTNDVSTASPWHYDDKSAPAGDGNFPHETFYEGLINLTALTGGGVCVSSFLAETRASESETATLKDFALSNFQLCGATGATTILAADDSTIPENSNIVVVGDAVHDKMTITGTIVGGGNAPEPASPPDVTFKLFNNGTCTAGASNVNVVFTSTVALVDNAIDDGISTATSGSFTLTAPGAYSWQATWPGNATYPGVVTAACEPFNVVQPTLRITKDVNTCLTPDTQDLGTFNLQVDGSTVPGGTGVKEGGDTGFNPFNPGAHTVGETSTTLAKYVVQIGGACTPAGSVTLTGSDAKTCAITNIRKPELIINKLIVGTPPDAGTFNLQVNGTTVDSASVPANTTYVSGDGSSVGNNAQVRIRIDTNGLGGEPASFGSFTVGETGAGASLSNYQTSIVCDDGPPQTQAAFISTDGSPRNAPAISLVAGNVVTCTITNIVKPLAAACPVQ